MTRSAVWAAACALLVGGAAVSQEGVVEKKIATARTEYEKAAEKARGVLLDALKKKADVAQKAGDLAALERVEAEIQAFEDKGTLPKSIPTKAFEGDLKKARTKLEDAYGEAVKAYTKAGQRAQAKSAQQELDDLKAGRAPAAAPPVTVLPKTPPIAPKTPPVIAPKTPPALPPAAGRKAGDVYTLHVGNPPAEMAFCWIPPGTFAMGGNGVADNPPHQVTIGKGFWMGRTEVTQAQWEAVTAGNPSKFVGPDRPVDQVSWDESQKYCTDLTALLKKQTGKFTVKLPTEAEWEYAARAGTTTEYWSGDGTEALRKAGWFRSNGGGQTHPVGKLAANPWGLFDVNGNVCEWCHDWLAGLTADGQTDPTGPAAGEYRSRRGGSWDHSPPGCVTAFRHGHAPGMRSNRNGFRVCFRADE